VLPTYVIQTLNQLSRVARQLRAEAPAARGALLADRAAGTPHSLAAIQPSYCGTTVALAEEAAALILTGGSCWRSS